MIRYLFSRIPALLFEPVAVCALIALGTAFFVFRKSHDRFYWITAGSLFFMIAWRLVCYNAAFSIRYSAILFYPAIIASSWIFFYLKDFLAKRGVFSHEKLALFPFAGIALLSIACAGKTLHYNPYDNHTVKICRRLQQEIAGKKFLLYSAIESDRIAYYAGIPREKVSFWDGNLHILNDCRNYYENCYFIFYHRKNTPETDVRFLNSKPCIGKWECLLREYTSRRKNKEIVLYRFIPHRPDVEIWEGKIPEMSSHNLCPNGDFESILTGQALNDRIDYYKRIKASDFYTKQGTLFPQFWWLGVSSVVNGKSPIMALNSACALAGKYSLEMNGSGIGESGINSGFIPKQDCTFSGYIKAMKDSFCRIYSCYWNEEEKRTVLIRTVFFTAEAGKIYKFKFPVRMADIPQKAKSIYIIVQTPGHILLDNVDFLRN